MSIHKQKLLAFISFYVGQQCYHDGELPPTLSLIDMMQGLDGILDTCIELTDKYMLLYPDFVYDLEQDDDLEIKIQAFLHEEIGEYNEQD